MVLFISALFSFFQSVYSFFTCRQPHFKPNLGAYLVKYGKNSPAPYMRSGTVFYGVMPGAGEGNQELFPNKKFCSKSKESGPFCEESILFWY
jgi:hypothetical protein